VAQALKPGDPRWAGPYELLERLGSGGMGQVFLGRSPGGRPVAVKVIRPDLLAGQPDFRDRFAREVAAARRVNALFTAPVVDAQPDGDMPWLVTAYVPGPSLADAVSEHGPMPAGALRSLAAGLAEGLAAIHAAGVVHRDLKPSNVLLAADGPRIIDFGISRAVDASALTGTGFLVGSPAFMSPEQAEGREAGPPSDVFSLGSVLAFAATGAGPFRAETVPALLYQVVNAAPAIAGVPPELRPLVERCLAKDPGARPAPAQILAELGRTGLLRDWLPQAVAATLSRYDVPGPAGGTAPADHYQRATAPAYPSPAPRTSPGPYPSSGPPPPPPYRPDLAYPPGPPRGGRPPRYGPPPGPSSGTGQWAASLPREYRFGWLSVPVLLFLGVAAFVAPLETLDGLTWGFALTLVITRLAGAAIWVRGHGTSGLAGRAVRSLGSDIAGAAGLAALAFGAIFLTVDVLLPAIGPGAPQDYRAALDVSGPADPFSSFPQAWFFLHLLLVPAALAVALPVLLRSRANLGRPLVLPRVAKLLNGQALTVRLAVTAGLVALAIALIGMNGGLAPASRPAGAICSIAPQTCAAATKIVAAHHG
jgi:serine/threonine protein kinase